MNKNSFKRNNELIEAAFHKGIFIIKGYSINTSLNLII
jgi:hypothetical protein